MIDRGSERTASLVCEDVFSTRLETRTKESNM